MNAYETLRTRGNLLRPDSPPAPKKKRNPLRRVSQKRQGENRKYLKLREEFLRAHMFCEGGAMDVCNQLSTDVHHVFGRRGKNYLDTSTWLAVCRPCHDWIHTHPKEARELHLLQ